CPRLSQAHAGLGYVRLQRNDLSGATVELDRAVALDSNDVDALFGRANAARRTNDVSRARTLLERALARAPNHAEARTMLASLPQVIDSTRLPARTRGVTTTIASRAARRSFEIPNGRGGWSPMWIKAVNIGAALPGKFPSEFPPDDGTYEEWLRTVA